MRPTIRRVPWVLCVLLSAGPSFGAWDPVEGVIEGRLLLAGSPLVGAQITTCADRGYFVGRQTCKSPIDTRTDSEGRFTFRQFTGVTPPTRQEIRSNPIYAVADPGWGYGFRVDYDGMAAEFYDTGMGYARTHVKLECDFGAFLAEMKKLDVRPVANPDNMPFIKCNRQEKRIEFQRE